ncbi:MAG: hypothetical protein ACLPXB_04740 [Thiobacillaceae bacterium]
MTAFDRRHLNSHDCRDSYQTGATPLVLCAALASALFFTYAERAYSAPCEPVGRLVLKSGTATRGTPMDDVATAVGAGRLRSLDRRDRVAVELAGGRSHEQGRRGQT